MVTRMRALITGLIVIGLASPASATEVRNFFAPQVAGSRIDACLTGGACGKPAADAFCKEEGYDRAVIFQREQYASTRTLDSGQICSKDCTALKLVKCFSTKSDRADVQAAL